jgi:sugar O-acyltransferase (sialic acid O-acetyltransferase NeuD family)
VAFSRQRKHKKSSIFLIMRDLFIVGAGYPDCVRTFFECKDNARYKLRGVLDDNNELTGKSLLGVPILGTLDLLDDFKAPWVFNSVALSKESRKIVNEKLKKFNVYFASIIHKSVNIDHCNIDVGCYIARTSYIESRSQIGFGSMILPGATIGHDTEIGDNCFIASGVHVGGNVNIGQYTWIGAGSCVHPGSIVGAGSVVDMNSNVTLKSSKRVFISNPRSKIRYWRE